MILNDVGDSEKKLESESDADTVVSCLKDSRPAWLEKWRGFKQSAVKSRIQQRGVGRSKPTVKRKGSSLVGSCTLNAFVESEALAKDTFTVKLHGPKGLGLSLFVSFEGVVTVDGLHYLPDGSPSPAQVCDVIKVGDQLVQFNDVNLEALTFYSLTNILKGLDNYGKDVVTLGFRYSEPPPLTGPDCNTPYGSSTPVPKAEPASTSAPRSRRSDLTIVPDPTDAFLSIFGELDGVPITPAHGIGLNMLEGVLHTLGAWRPHKRQSHRDWDTGPQTSDLEAIHHVIASRHMYATAARTSTFASLPSLNQQLCDLADELFEWRPFQLSALYAGFYSHLRLDGVGSKAGYVPPMGPLSALIISPRDTARYLYTEHLTWDAQLQGYVPMSVPTVEEWNASYAQQLQAIAQILVQLELATQDRIARYSGLLSLLHPTEPTGSSTRALLNATAAPQDRNVVYVLELPDGLRCHGASTPPNATTASNSKASGSVSQVRVTTVPYVPRRQRNPSAHGKPTTYARLDEHVINRDHMMVKRLLGAHSEEATQLVTAAVQEEIASLTASTARDNPYANAKHWDTNWDLSLPNILLTYQLLYVAEQFQHGVLNDAAYFAALDAWATTFDPKTIISALEWQHTPQYYQTHQHTNNQHKHGTHSGGAKHKRAQFMVYFGHDRRTARDLRVFIEVVSDLLTLLVLNRTVSSAVTRKTHTVAGRTHNKDTKLYGGKGREQDRQAISSVFLLKHLPFQLSTTHGREHTTIRTDPVLAEQADALTASYVRKFGVLLHLDALASACCLAQRSETLQALLVVAQTCPAVSEASTQLQSFVQRSQSTVVGAAQLLDRVLNHHHQPHQHQQNQHQNQNSPGKSTIVPQLHLHGMPMLCLVLCNLRFVFEHHTALALDLSGVMFPHIRPWNVRSAIFGLDAVLCTTPSPAGQLPSMHRGLSPEAAEPPLAQAVNTCYAYVTRLMRSHADTCSKDADLVLEWLQLALQLDSEQAENGPDGAMAVNSFASPMGKRKSSYLVTARTILQHPQQYTIRALDAALLCGAYGYTEGVIYMGQRILSLPVQRPGADQPALSRVEADELTRLLEEATGKLIVEVIYQLGSDGSTTPAPDVASAALSHIGVFLGDSIYLLRILYALVDCMNDLAPCAGLAKTLDLLLEGSLEAMTSAEDKEDCQSAAVASRVANVVCNVLQETFGVRGSLEMLRSASYLQSILRP